MGPVPAGSAVPFRVSLDGRPVGAAGGADVDADGAGILREQRTYQLVRQPGPIEDARFEIEFLAAGAEAYCFTFG
jgi:Thioredoxin like C-terminal domain